MDDEREGNRGAQTTVTITLNTVTPKEPISVYPYVETVGLSTLQAGKGRCSGRIGIYGSNPSPAQGQPPIRHPSRARYCRPYPRRTLL